MNFSTMIRTWGKEYSESRRELNPWPPRYRLGALTNELRETRGELGHLLGRYVTRVLHSAGISNVKIIKCVVNIKDGQF